MGYRVGMSAGEMSDFDSLNNLYHNNFSHFRIDNTHVIKTSKFD